VFAADAVTVQSKIRIAKQPAPKLKTMGPMGGLCPRTTAKEKRRLSTKAPVCFQNILKIFQNRGVVVHNFLTKEGFARADTFVRFTPLPTTDESDMVDFGAIRDCQRTKQNEFIFSSSSSLPKHKFVCFKVYHVDVPCLKTRPM
jgi:hypothetical protein